MGMMPPSGVRRIDQRLFTQVPRIGILRTSPFGISANFALKAFYEVGSLDVFLEVLEVGCLVGASPYTISRPEWGLAPMTLG
jgi:hypothetical protein